MLGSVLACEVVNSLALTQEARQTEREPHFSPLVYRDAKLIFNEAGRSSFGKGRLECRYGGTTHGSVQYVGTRRSPNTGYSSSPPRRLMKA